MHVNKFGQVPVLVERRDDDDDDSMRFVLTESSAILKYLSETFSKTVSASKMYHRCAENERDDDDDDDDDALKRKQRFGRLWIGTKRRFGLRRWFVLAAFVARTWDLCVAGVI